MRKIIFYIFILLIFLECYSHFVLQPSDYLNIKFDREFGVHLQGDQEGVFSIWSHNKIRGKYSVNLQGWNSIHYNYSKEKDDSTLRVAIIGDSYIEGRHVNIKKTCSTIADSLLNKKGKYEVFPFAYSGWPASHYIYVIPSIIDIYQPDIIIIHFEENDFDDSINRKNAKEGYATHDGKNLIAPTNYQTPFYKKIISLSAIARYFKYNSMKSHYNNNENSFNDYNRSIDKKAKQIANDLFLKLNKIKFENKINLHVLFDGNRKNIYKNSIISKDYHKDNFLNELTTIALKQGIPYTTLDSLFFYDFINSQKFFNFENDYHWNEYGHYKVGNLIYEIVNKVHL